MRLSDTLQSARKGVTIDPTRSALTMLGIIIGVGAVVLMSAIGASMQGVILSQISSLGPQSMIIFPGNDEGGPNGVMAGFDSLTLEDIEQIRRLPTVTNVSPTILIGKSITYERQTSGAQVLGVYPEAFGNSSLTAAEGRLFDRAEVEGAKAVAVLGPDAQEKLFAGQDPIGRRIKIGDASYTVVGVASALGSQFFQNADDRVYVPFTVARTQTGQRFVNYVTMEAVTDFDTAFADVKDLLRRRHSIENPKDDPKKDDFTVRNSAQAQEILSGVSLGLTMFVTTIAAISLVVGGIGIMNIMLVTVTERTREIGLRKALGALSKDILRQFLIEAVLLTFIGGVIGIVLGVGGAWFISLIVRPLLDTYQFAISITSIVAALFMAGLTGLVFGLSPARRAAALPPMEALRYE
ncbi:MAG: ABC transporter permease [Candidatus Peribacteraceae bacterium]|nr:ABC transporter permease [Candidatus Peribacteraceae bacterium]